MPFTKGGEKTNLKQYHDTGDDGSYSIYENNALAQCFKPVVDHYLYAITIKVSSMFLPKPLICYVTRATSWGWPIGPVLAQRTIPGTGLPTYSPKWVPFYFNQFPFLEADKLYVFSLLSTGSGIFNCPIIRADRTPPGYDRGWLLTSDDWGAHWWKRELEDIVFREWGWEPPPDPPPPPAITNWAPLSIEQPEVEECHTITVTTDIPVHLFMRWTTKKPLTHSKELIRRGISLPNATRWCFVAWHEVEQEEDGDTLTHTFILCDWQICETRYFYFLGTKQDEESPSASPIFHYHRKGVKWCQIINEPWTS